MIEHLSVVQQQFINFHQPSQVKKFPAKVVTFLWTGNPLYHPTNARADNTPCKSWHKKTARFYNGCIPQHYHVKQARQNQSTSAPTRQRDQMPPRLLHCLKDRSCIFCRQAWWRPLLNQNTSYKVGSALCWWKWENDRKSTSAPDQHQKLITPCLYLQCLVDVHYCDHQLSCSQTEW